MRKAPLRTLSNRGSGSPGLRLLASVATRDYGPAHAFRSAALAPPATPPPAPPLCPPAHRPSLQGRPPPVMQVLRDVPRLPPHASGTPVLSVLDMHAGGEPLRIVLAGWPEVGGSTLLAKRRYVRERQDGLRRRVMLEPRGHRDMYGALPVRSELPEAHLGVLFLHNEGYSSMCGHAVLALGRFAVDHGLAPPPPPGAAEAQVRLHCPCGLVTAFVECAGGRSRGPVRFHSVPAFVLATDVVVNVPGKGEVVVDIGYGGAFYAFVDAKRFGLDVCSSKIRDLVDAATAVTEAVKGQVKIHHPYCEDLSFLYGTILTDGNDAFTEEPTTNICVFADAQVDRSPTGSGVTARIALQYHKGLIQLNQTRTFKSSATGSLFTGKPLKETKCGEFKAVVVEVSGQAYYTGAASFIIEEEDPLKNGFLLK